jgi:hypothetical protein
MPRRPGRIFLQAVPVPMPDAPRRPGAISRCHGADGVGATSQTRHNQPRERERYGADSAGHASPVRTYSPVSGARVAPLPWAQCNQSRSRMHSSVFAVQARCNSAFAGCKCPECNRQLRAVPMRCWQLPLAWRCITSQLRCPANSAAFRSGDAFPRFVRPVRYRPPGQVPFWSAIFCVGVHVAIAPGMPYTAGLSPGLLASGVSVFCSPGTVRKTSATSAGCPPVSRRISPGFPVPGADVRGFPTQWPSVVSAFRQAAP